MGSQSSYGIMKKKKKNLDPRKSNTNIAFTICNEYKNKYTMNSMKEKYLYTTSLQSSKSSSIFSFAKAASNSNTMLVHNEFMDTIK